MSAGIAKALAHRADSTVGLTVSDARDRLTCALDSTRHFISASVIKATIISALLRKVGGPDHLTKYQKPLAWKMITLSDNAAATKLWNDAGGASRNGAIQAFLDKAGMRHTVLSYAWGLTQITAQDEMTLLRVLTTNGQVLSTASRNYVLYLMANVVSYERWGVPAGAPSDVTVHVKNGWLPYPNLNGKDWHINSIGAFTGHDIGYQIVILTQPARGVQGESYGIQTVQAAAEVINAELAGKPASSSAAPAMLSPPALSAPGG